MKPFLSLALAFPLALAVSSAPALPSALALSPTTLGEDPPDVRGRFEALDDAGDQAGVEELWRAHPFEVLSVIDSYLEGSLAAIEAQKLARGSDEVRAMHERALRGARAADRAFGRALFLDYASSFAGWSAEQATAFRAGQQAFGEHRTALRAGELERALESARRCVELAEPLGDWWGTAMGLGGEGAALAALGRHEEALVPLARARVLNHDLGLASAEYRALRTLADSLLALERVQRARSALSQAVELAQALGDEAGRAELAKKLAELERTR